MILKNLRHRLRLAWSNVKLMARFDVLIEKAVTIKYTETITFGRHCTVQSGAYIYGSRSGNAVDFGNYTVVGCGAIVLGEGGFSLGDFSHLSPGVVVTTQYGDSTGEMITPTPRIKYAKVTIGRGCWINTGSVVMPGASLGDRCTVAPHSVVYGHWPNDSHLSGNPARRSWLRPPKPLDIPSAAG